jgi:hypothetical protein
MDYFDHVSKSTTWEVVGIYSDRFPDAKVVQRVVFETPVTRSIAPNIEPFERVTEVEERELTDEEIEHFRKAVAERYQREGCL